MQAMKVDVFFVPLVIIPEICILIWGNTFIYTSEMYGCRTENDEGYRIQSLWRSALVIIIYGYFFMAVSCGVCLIGLAGAYTYK